MVNKTAVKSAKPLKRKSVARNAPTQAAAFIAKERFYQQVLESMKEGVSLSDASGTIIYTNPAEDEMFGYKRGELIGQHVSVQNTYTPEESKRIVKEVTRHLKQKGVWHGEFSNRKKDGTAFNTSAKVTALELAGKKYWLCVQVDITEIKRTVDKVRESEARAIAVYNQAAVAMSITALDGSWIDFNRVYPKIFGYSRTELLKMSFTQITHPDDREADSVNIRLLIKGELKEYTREKRYIHKSGSIVYALIHVTAVRNDKGEAQYILATLQDITERKKNELRQAFLDKVSDILFTSFEDNRTIEKVAKLIVHHIADYCRIAIVDENGKLSDITVNHTDPSKVQLATDLYDEYKDDPNATQGVFKILKTGKAEITPIIDDKVFESIKDNPKLIKIVKSIGLKSYMGIPLIAHDKVIGAITFSSATPERIYDKKDLSFVKEVGRRIALALENARARRELQVSEEHFRSLADSMPQIVWTARPDGYIDYYNQQWYTYTGFVAGDNGQNWQSILHPGDVDYCLNIWSHSVQTGEPYQMEYRFKDRQRPGKYRWFLGKALPVRNEKGEIIKWFGSCTDIDDIRRTIQSKQRLEKITSTLTAQRAELVALNRAKDEFISLASHQLRTPATGVKQYLGMTLEGYAGELNEQQRAFLQQAYESNERQITTVNDLLQVAKIDAGKVVLEKQKLDLISLINDVIQEQNKAFTDRKQKVIFNPPVKKLETVADMNRMRMVLENIIDNASKYTPPKKQIEIKVTKAKNLVKIMVKDQGVGMAEADIEKIFEKFSRLDNPLSVAVGGTGLGLYWAKKITDLHGGSINVESKLGKGSVFTVSLPAVAGSSLHAT